MKRVLFIFLAVASLSSGCGFLVSDGHTVEAMERQGYSDVKIQFMTGLAAGVSIVVLLWHVLVGLRVRKLVREHVADRERFVADLAEFELLIKKVEKRESMDRERLS